MNYVQKNVNSNQEQDRDILMGKYDMSYIVVMPLRWFLVYHSNKGQQFLDWHENECEVYTPVE